MNLMLSQPKLDTTSPVRAEAVFDPPVARPGERVIYRLSFNALRDSILWDGRLPGGEIKGLPASSGQIMQMAGTNYQPRSSFNYHSATPREGQFVAPAFNVRVAGRNVRVPEVSLIVSNGATSPPPQMLYLDITPERPFVGESVRVRIFSPASPSGVVQGLGQVQLMGKGFLHELTATRQSVETLPFNGKMTPHYIYETTLTPISPGKETIYAQGFAIGNRFSGPVTITGPAVIAGNMLQYTLLDSDPMRVEFRPLPPDGRPPGFSGGVGVYSVDPPQLSTNTLAPGEPVRLSVSIRGRGNLGRLSLPPPPAIPDWQVLPAKRENLPAQVLDARGFANFTCVLVPLKGGLKSTPALPFSFFHPEKEVYVSRDIPSVPVTVLPGNAPADMSALLDQRMASGPKEPVLSELSGAQGKTVATLVPLQLQGWFPAVQLAPAVFFLGLWQWDRRRRYLEAHPDVVARRRARRGLRIERRKMRMALKRGNAAGYQESAVRAVQVASAPHFPAESDAVVSTDALELLADAAAETRGAVERLFEASNSARFAGRSVESLLQDHKAIERALDVLEGKL